MSDTPSIVQSTSLLGAKSKVIFSKPGTMLSTTTTPPTPTILKKFTLFPKLPLELQDMIW
ncbi:hypothetical protein IFR05_013815, partial [Cadophora sp. M221]